MATSPNVQPENEMKKKLEWKKLMEYTAVYQNLTGRISSLQMTAFNLANFFFVSQAVIFTALSGDSSLACRDVWFPLTLSLLPGALNLFALFKIGRDYIETGISQNIYKELQSDQEIRATGGQSLGNRSIKQIRDAVETTERKKGNKTLYCCMCAFGFCAAVVAFGSLWMLCGENIIFKHHAKCVKLCDSA